MFLLNSEHWEYSLHWKTILEQKTTRGSERRTSQALARWTDFCLWYVQRRDSRGGGRRGAGTQKYGEVGEDINWSRYTIVLSGVAGAPQRHSSVCRWSQSLSFGRWLQVTKKRLAWANCRAIKSLFPDSRVKKSKETAETALTFKTQRFLFG